MNTYLLYIACSALAIFSCLSAKEDRRSSAPYISGDSFRLYCDFTFDELNEEIDFHQMKKGSTVFLKSNYLDKFFKEIHPLIPFPYILVTHNSDDSSPGNYMQELEGSKIIAWFGQNVSISHTKLHPIPIGVANRCWPHGNIHIIRNQQQLINHLPKNFLLYMNFSVPENTSAPLTPSETAYLLERQAVNNLLT